MSDNESTGKNQESPERDEHGRLLPGHTANPNGRPKKGEAITDVLKRYLEELDEYEPITRKEKLIREMYGKAVKDGYFPAQKYITDRIDGEPTKTQEITGKDGEALTIKVEFVSPDEDQSTVPETTQ